MSTSLLHGKKSMAITPFPVLVGFPFLPDIGVAALLVYHPNSRPVVPIWAATFP
ncbi:MAG: hypothetical protein PHE53_06725 [Thermoguttaceae bacterium]|nr:hypothetical protein [Thermoguttaceae bacterium]